MFSKCCLKKGHKQWKDSIQPFISNQTTLLELGFNTLLMKCKHVRKTSIYNELQQFVQTCKLVASTNSHWQDFILLWQNCWFVTKFQLKILRIVYDCWAPSLEGCEFWAPLLRSFPAPSTVTIFLEDKFSTHSQHSSHINIITCRSSYCWDCEFDFWPWVHIHALVPLTDSPPTHCISLAALLPQLQLHVNTKDLLNSTIQESTIETSSLKVEFQH